MSTLGWDFDRAAKGWAAAADEVRRFQLARPPGEERYLLVRFEDLVDDLKGTLADVLRFVDLDEREFDFDAAAHLPVRGSSAYFGSGRTSVHWDPVPRGPDFDPRERWRSWTNEMHERFEWIAGRQSHYFGYSTDVGGVLGGAKALRHRMLDGRWLVKTKLRRYAYAARVRIGTATRPLRERLGLVRTDR